MHMKLLKVFCDVVGQRSFSRAADENGISQSGASQMVHQLEDHLGVRLLDRSKRPFVLTPEGEVFHEGCRKLVQRYFALEEEVRTLHAEVSGRVSVARRTASWPSPASATTSRSGSSDSRVLKARRITY